jgi:hypothetical protein
MPEMPTEVLEKLTAEGQKRLADGQSLAEGMVGLLQEAYKLGWIDGSAKRHALDEAAYGASGRRERREREVDCPHAHTFFRKADETFLEQQGCLDCNEWLDPVRLRRR